MMLVGRRGRWVGAQVPLHVLGLVAGTVITVTTPSSPREDSGATPGITERIPAR